MIVIQPNSNTALVLLVLSAAAHIHGILLVCRVLSAEFHNIYDHVSLDISAKC